jgi:hypothetical protein
MNASPAVPRSSFCRFFTIPLLLVTIGLSEARAQIAPKIISVTPAIGDTNAAPRQSVVFVFDQTMEATLPMLSVLPSLVGNFQFTPLNLNSYFNGSWSADHKTLTFKPSLAIPLNTAITWTLNPTGVTVPFKSAAGIPLETTAGNYKIASNSGGSPSETCPPITTGSYTISKNLQYGQTGPNSVTPQASITAIFSAQVSSPSGGPVVTNATLTLPNSTTKNLTNQAGVYRLTQTFTNQTSLEAAFPAGSYILRFIQTNDVQHEIPMTLPDAPGVVPQIVNYAEAQNIDATKDFTLKWNAFSPQPAGAVVRLVVADEFGNRIFLAPNQCVPRTLDPTATSVTIPANYLRPGFVYQAQLIFSINFYNSTTDAAPMNGNGFVQRITAFSMKAAIPGEAPPENCFSGTTTAGSYSLLKVVSYKQTSAADVVLQNGQPAFFAATIASPTLGPAVTNGSLTLPDTTQQALTNQTGYYILNHFFNAEADLETGYPSGGYTLRFTQNGQTERVIDMAVADMPVSIPKIINFDEGQAIDPTKEFTLRWDPFTPQVPGAFIQLVISDGTGRLVFLAPNPCIPRALDPTATSIVIPTNYFSAGLTYYGQLVFGVNFYSDTDTNGMVGYGAAQRQMSFSLTSTNGAVAITPAQFTGYRVLPNGHPQMDLSGAPNRIYTIIRSRSILNANWNSSGSVTMSGSGTAVFEDSDATLKFPAYYRAVGN